MNWVYKISVWGVKTTPFTAAHEDGLHTLITSMLKAGTPLRNIRIELEQVQTAGAHATSEFTHEF